MSKLVWLLAIVQAPVLGAPAQDSSVKIVGGTPAVPGEFPFTVSLQARGSSGQNSHTCGGTLVSLSRVITAGHCMKYVPTLDRLVVVAGAHFLRDAQRGIQQLREVQKVTIHPGFDGNTNHDLAVIDLITPFSQNNLVAPIQLAQKQQEYSGRCTIAGWGQTENHSMSEELIKGSLSVNPNSLCQLAYPGEFDPQYQICAGNLNGEIVDGCEGDTGGGLICSNPDGSKYLAGVSSWGHMCGKHGYPGVYMAISKYRNWLDYVLAEGSTSTTTVSTTTSTKATTRRPNPPDFPKVTTLAPSIDDDQENEPELTSAEIPEVEPGCQQSLSKR